MHAALVSSGVSQADRFQRVIQLAAADFRFDSKYPALGVERNDDFVSIEIRWSVGRSVKMKKKLLEDLMACLSSGLIHT